MIKIYKILFRYLSQSYLISFLIFCLLIAVVLTISNTLNVLNQTKAINLSPVQLLQLILFKIPYLLQEVLAFVSLIAALISFDQLSKSNELIIIKNSGLSIWQLITPAVIITGVIGILWISCLNPIAAILLKRHEKLEMSLLHRSPNLVTISSSGIMVKEKNNDTNRIIIANNISSKSFSLDNVTILVTDTEGNFRRRINAKHALLQNGKWLLNEAKIFYLNNPPITIDEYVLKTNLSMKELVEQLASPETIPIWRLPEFASKLHKAGLSPTKHLDYFYKLLFKPILMAATIFVAACFINIHPRNNRNSYLILGGIITGFLIHFLVEVLSVMLITKGVGVAIAVLTPILFIILGSKFILLQLQETTS